MNRRRFSVIMKVTVFGVVLYALLAATVGVSFDRRVAIDNDPLTNSIAVTSISGNCLNLADGTVIVMWGYNPKELSEDMRAYGNRVELDRVDSHSASVIVKRRRFICGTGAPLVVIPLIRREYPRYSRHLLGVGEFQ